MGGTDRRRRAASGRAGARGTAARKALALCAVLALSACSAQYRHHGYTPSDADLAGIAVGVDTRATVEERIGLPSTSGVLDDSGFYYVESTMRHFAWREPQVVERQVLAISFDEAGVVRNIERYGLEDGRAVPLSRRITRSGGQSGFLRQLLARLGRFSASDFLE